MDKIPFEDGVKLKNATVTIQEKEYEVKPAQYRGKTPMSSFNLNKMQNNIENTLVKVSPTEPSPKSDIWLKKGKNLFNKNRIIKNYYIKDEDGSISEYDSNMCYGFDYIEVSPSAKYTMSNATSTIFLIAEYDENKNFIKQNRQNDSNNFLTITTGEKTKYIRISLGQTQIQTIQFEAGDKTEYEEYIEPKVYVKSENGKYLVFKEDRTINVISETEFETGRIINGKKEYGKRIEGGVLPSSAGNKNIPTGLSNINFIRMEGIITSSDICSTVPFTYTGQPNIYHYFSPTSNAITIRVSDNASKYSIIETIYYTKK